MNVDIYCCCYYYYYANLKTRHVSAMREDEST